MMKIILMAVAIASIGCQTMKASRAIPVTADETIVVGMTQDEVDDILQDRRLRITPVEGGGSVVAYDYRDRPSWVSNKRAYFYFPFRLLDFIFWPLETYIENEANVEAIASYDKAGLLLHFAIVDDNGADLGPPDQHGLDEMILGFPWEETLLGRMFDE